MNTTDYKYSLEKGSRKVECPSCGKRRLVSYIENKTGKVAGAQYGRCDREQDCGYHIQPTDKGKKKSSWYRPNEKRAVNPIIPHYNVSNINDWEDTRRTTHQKNHFVLWLESLFGESVFDGLYNKYSMGQVMFWNQYCPVFWYISHTGEIRGGKIMGYTKNGKREKREVNGNTIPIVSWHHSTVKKNKNYKLNLCFFGERLLNKYPDATVYLVESEKTAVFCSLYYNDDSLIFLATGMLQGINDTNSRALENRHVVLCPDTGKATDVWCEGTINKEGYKIPSKKSIIQRYAKKVDVLDYQTMFPTIPIEDGEDLVDMILKQDNYK